MTNLNEQVATEIMEWFPINANGDFPMFGVFEDGKIEVTHQGESGIAIVTFDFSNDLNDCALAEKRMEELEKEEEYAIALSDEVLGWDIKAPDCRVDIYHIFELATASPEQRCRAMLKAKGVEVDD